MESTALVVEDDSTVAELLAHLLRRLGHEVRVAHDASTAAELLALSKYAVVTLDLALADGDGERVLAAAVGAARKVLVVSAARNASKVAEKYGVARLDKPFRISDFEHALVGVSPRAHGFEP